MWTRLFFCLIKGGVQVSQRRCHLGPSAGSGSGFDQPDLSWSCDHPVVEVVDVFLQQGEPKLHRDDWPPATPDPVRAGGVKRSHF